MHVWPQDGLPDNAGRSMSHGRRVGKIDLEDAAIFLGVRILDRPVQVGDMYLAGRNTGVKLLTATRIDHRRWVENAEGFYPFDTWECVPVEDIKEQSCAVGNTEPAPS